MMWDGDPVEAREFYVSEKRAIFYVLFGILIVAILATWFTWGASTPTWAWTALGALSIATVWGGYVPYFRALNCR